MCAKREWKLRSRYLFMRRVITLLDLISIPKQKLARKLLSAAGQFVCSGEDYAATIKPAISALIKKSSAL